MFQSDLVAGQAIEKKLGDTLIQKGIKVVYNNSTQLDELRKYDLKIYNKDKEIKIEVKADFMSSVTGNIAVELNCINKSESKYFAYYIPHKDSFYFIKTSILTSKYRNGDYVRLTSSCENGADLMLLRINDLDIISTKILKSDSE